MKIVSASTITDERFLSIQYPPPHIKLPFGRYISSVRDLIAVGKQMKNCLVQRYNIEKYTKNILKNKWNIYYVDEGEDCLFCIDRNVNLLESECTPSVPYELASNDYSFLEQRTPENALCIDVGTRIKSIQRLIKSGRDIFPALSPKDQLMYIYRYGHIIKMLPVDYNIFSGKSLGKLSGETRRKIIYYVKFGLTDLSLKPKVYERVCKSLSQFSGG